MSDTPQKARVVCFNSDAARRFQDVGLKVVPGEADLPCRPIYDLAPVVYVHSRSLIVAEPLEGNGRSTADQELWALFYRALKEAGISGPPSVVLLKEGVPELIPSIAKGLVLGAVFVEKVPVDDRVALLPWGAWREAARLRDIRVGPTIGGPTPREIDLRKWRGSWKVPADLLALRPSLEYTPDLLKDLLPVRPPPFGWTRYLAGTTPPAESLRQERLARRQPMEYSYGSPGFHYRVLPSEMKVLVAANAPTWAADLLPTDGLKARVIVHASDAAGLPKRTVTEAVAEFYHVPAADVRIVPLYANALGDCLGCAVRIGKGVVLLLPDFSDKAAAIKRLVTDLWGPITVWLAGAASPPAKRTESTVVAPTPAQTEGKPGVAASVTDAAGRPADEPGKAGAGGSGQAAILAENEKRAPAPPPEAPVQAPASAGPAGIVRKIKEPPKEAIAAYRLEFLQGKTQTAIAAELSQEFHRPISQGRICRWLKQVKKYVEAGNVLPDIEGLHKKPTSVDPANLDMGPRQDGLTKNQRPRRDDDDSGWTE